MIDNIYLDRNDSHRPIVKRNANFRERYVYMITRTMCMYFHT